MRSYYAVLATVLLVAACTPTSDGVGRDIGPGDTIASPQQAAALMQSVCGAANPVAAGQANGFARRPSTGTLFHQGFDLSINPEGSSCTLVYITAASEREVSAALQSVPATVNRAAPNPLRPGTNIYRATYAR